MAPPLALRHDVPLAPLTTLGVGGRARHYARVADRETLLAALAWADEERCPVLLLGGGSNLLIADAGFDGLVIDVALRGLRWTPLGEAVELRAAAGEEWDPIVAHAAAQGWAGIECLSGIPGRVGAAPIQNIGAYGQEIAATLVRVEALDVATGTPVEFEKDACALSYRSSRFKNIAAGRHVVLAVILRLQAGGPAQLAYPELIREIERRQWDQPTPAQVREVVLALRRGKAMLLDAGEPEARSAGSFFENLLLDTCAWTSLRERSHELGFGLPPSFPHNDGRTKVPAAWLIERAGFAKGYQRGNAAISRRHALALVNRGGASAREIVTLAREIRDGVARVFDVRLAPEVRLVGLSLDA